MNKIRWNTKDGQPKLEVNEDGRWLSYRLSINYKEDKLYHFSGFTTFLACREQGYEIEYTLPEEVIVYIDLKAEEYGYKSRLMDTQCLGLYKEGTTEMLHEIPYKAVLNLMSLSGNYRIAVDTIFQAMFT